MPRFVILYHETPPGSERPPHFDLMLEVGTALRTWELPRWPAADQPVLATQLADHRLAYLDYEGPISGGRGQVTRHESGSCEILSETSETIVLNLQGQRLKGVLTLRRVAPDVPQWDAAWQP